MPLMSGLNSLYKSLVESDFVQWATQSETNPKKFPYASPFATDSISSALLEKQEQEDKLKSSEELDKERDLKESYRVILKLREELEQIRKSNGKGLGGFQGVMKLGLDEIEFQTQMCTFHEKVIQKKMKARRKLNDEKNAAKWKEVDLYDSQKRADGFVEIGSYIQTLALVASASSPLSYVAAAITLANAFEKWTNDAGKNMIAQVLSNGNKQWEARIFNGLQQGSFATSVVTNILSLSRLGANPNYLSGAYEWLKQAGSFAQAPAQVIKARYEQQLHTLEADLMDIDDKLKKKEIGSELKVIEECMYRAENMRKLMIDFSNQDVELTSQIFSKNS